jgi:hypothetical protein
MTKAGWLLAIVAGVFITAFIWSACSHQKGRSHSKSILVVQRIGPVQESNVEEQQQVGQTRQFGQSEGQFGNFQGVGGSFNGGSFQGGFCGSFGALGGSQPE